MLSDDGRPSSDEAISVCDDDGLPALDWNAGRLNLSFRLLLSYLRLTINFVTFLYAMYYAFMSISCRRYLWLNVLLCLCLCFDVLFSGSFDLPSILPLSCVYFITFLSLFTVSNCHLPCTPYHVLYFTLIRITIHRRFLGVFACL